MDQAHEVRYFTAADWRCGAGRQFEHGRIDLRARIKRGIRYGADQAHARIHTTIAMPGATAQSTGLPDNPGKGGAWIMNPGTTTAHLMTPGS